MQMVKGEKMPRYIDFEQDIKLVFCENCKKWVKVRITTVTRCPICGDEVE